MYDLVPPPALVNGTTGWIGYTSGTAFTMGWTPVLGDVLIMVSYTNQMNVTNISQTGVTWGAVANAYLSSNAWSMMDMWLGVVGTSPSTSITITCNGNNVQDYALAEFSSPSGIVVAKSSGVAGSGSISESITLMGQGGIAIAATATRGSGLVGPSESGWTDLISAGTTPNGVGQGTIAYQLQPTKFTNLSASFTGANNQESEILAVIA